MGDRPEKDDNELAAEFLAGDLESFREFYRRYVSEVLAVCQKILQNRQDAEDVVSDVFFELWTKRSRFDPTRATPKNYLLMLTRSRSIDRYRKRSRANSRKALHAIATNAESAVAVSQGNPAVQILQSESQQLAIQALEQLNDEQRRMLELTYFESLSHAQIAERLDIPLGTVKSHIRRGILKLRAVLDERKVGTANS